MERRYDYEFRYTNAFVLSAGWRFAEEEDQDSEGRPGRVARGGAATSRVVVGTLADWLAERSGEQKKAPKKLGSPQHPAGEQATD